MFYTLLQPHEFPEFIFRGENGLLDSAKTLCSINSYGNCWKCHDAFKQTIGRYVKYDTPDGRASPSATTLRITAGNAITRKTVLKKVENIYF